MINAFEPGQSLIVTVLLMILIALVAAMFILGIVGTAIKVWRRYKRSGKKK